MQDRVRKDSFSGPRYLLAAAKAAAGVRQGKDFSPWLVEAITEKLEQDHPKLIERVRRALAERAHAPAWLMNESDPSAATDALVRWALELEQSVVRVALGEIAESGKPFPERPKRSGPRKPRT